MWVFNETNTDTEYADFAVTDAISVSGLTCVMNPTDRELVLDETNSDMQVKVDVTSQIDFINGLIGTYQIDHYDYSSTSLFTENKIGVVYDISSEITGAMNSYIKTKTIFYETSNDMDANPYQLSKEYQYQGKASFTDSLTFTIIYQWKENMVPSTKEDFSNLMKAMNDTVHPSKINITAEIVSAYEI